MVRALVLVGILHFHVRGSAVVAATTRGSTSVYSAESRLTVNRALAWSSTTAMIIAHPMMIHS